MLQFPLFSSLQQKAVKSGTAFTLLDAIRLYATIVMVIDHIGFYFYPDNLWWRIIGHTGSPLPWFFLLGFSRKRRIDTTLILYAFATIGTRAILGPALLPFNIFFSFIVCRIWLNLCEDYKILEKPVLLVGICLLAIAATPFLDQLTFEYSGSAIMATMLGRMVREQRHKGLYVIAGGAVMTALVSGFLGWAHPPTGAQSAVFILSNIAIAALLTSGKNFTIIPDWTKSLPMALVVLLCRNTMHFYFFHVLIIQLIWIMPHLLQPR